MAGNGKHPLLHPKLNNFTILASFQELISTDQKAISFLEEISLIPSRSSTPPHCCGIPMRVEEFKDKKLGWVWRCSSKGHKKKSAKVCRKIKNPCEGTFFDGSSCRIKIRDVLAVMILFVCGLKISDVYEHLLNWRRLNNEDELSWTTLVDYFSYCREVAEVIASHTDLVLGGEGKTVQIDETFLTKRKYNRGRVTEQMTVIVLGLYCKEDKTGLFFRVNSKSKKDLWPFIQKYVNYNTSRLCTDSARQYHGVEKMFSPGTVHLKTNHQKGEYVSKENPLNTINDLENQNKLLKKTILCRRTPKLLHQYMALYFYKKYFLLREYRHDLGSRIMTFLLDVKKVYPGFIDGELKEGLSLKIIDQPILESERIEDVGPSTSKIPRLEEEAESANEIEEDIDKELSEQENLPDDFF